MKKERSWAKKLLALILSGILMISSIPIALATDNSTKDEPAATSDKATADEALGAEDYPTIEANKEAPSYKDDDGSFYVSKDEFTKLTVKMLIDDSMLEDMKADIDNSDFSKFYTALDHSLGGTGLGTRVTYSLSGNVLTAEYDMTFGVGENDYTLRIQYNSSDLYNDNVSVMKNPPVIDNVKYDESEEISWSNEDVVITFDVDSPIIGEVTINGEVLSGNSGAYSYKATESGEYTIVATDKLGHANSYSLGSIKIDTMPPTVDSVKYKDASGNEISDWTNQDIFVWVTCTDNESLVNKDSIRVNGEVPSYVSGSKAVKTFYFPAKEIKDYVITLQDNATNDSTYTVKKEDIKIDKEAPKAEDITLRFSDPKEVSDSILSFLSFGAYSNKDVKVEVEVDNGGLSEIDPASIKLYNGEEELAKDGDAYILPAPENEGESNNYDLYVEAADLAGNKSGKISFNKQAVKAKLGEDSENVKDLSATLYELIISKVVPDINSDYDTDDVKDGVKFEYEHSKTVDGKLYVSGEGKASVKVTEAVTGLKSVKMFLDGAEVTAEYSNTDTSKKITEQIASIKIGKLANGTHTVECVATANSGEQKNVKVEFTCANDGPQPDGDAVIGNDADTKWSNTPVTVTQKFKDSSVGIKSVKYYNSTKISDPKDSDLKDAEPASGNTRSFNAEEYGEYTIIATDELGNKTIIPTKKILIDTENPEVVESSVKPSVSWTSWSKDPVTITFNVIDKPADCSGVAKVTVDGTEVTPDENGKCEYKADHYGEYKIVVTDNATNVSDTFTTKTVKIDKEAPSIKSVSFSADANLKEYGAYSNKKLAMTVTVEDPAISESVAGSGVKVNEFKLEDRNDSSTVFTPVNKSVSSGTATFKYEFNPTDVGEKVNIRNFKFTSVDVAGNSRESYIYGEDKDNTIAINISDEVKDFEVIASLATAVINEPTVEFTNGNTKKDGVNYHSGQGTFTTKIEDKFLGIDEYKIFFTDSKNVKRDSGNKVTSVDDTPKKAVSDISKAEKVTELEIGYTTEPYDKLASGNYSYVVWVKNLCGNEIYLPYDLTVDNKAPEITSFEITTTGGSENDTINDWGVYSKEKITIKANYTDEPYSVGVSKVQFYNDGKEIGGNSDTLTLEANDDYHISALVTDEFNQAKDKAQAINSVPVKVNGADRKTDSNFEIVVNNDKNALHYSEVGYNNFAHKEDVENDSGITVKFLKPQSGSIISASVENTLSGIKSFKAAVNKIGESTPLSLTVTEDNPKPVMDNVYNKLVAKTLNVDVSSLESGSYHVKFTAVDLGGVTNTIEEDFYIDKTAPTFKSLVVSDVGNDTLASKILNVLSFGIYSKEDLQVTVTVVDAGPSYGIDADNCIALYSKKGKKIDGQPGAVMTTTTFDADKEYTKKFILRKTDSYEEEEQSFYNELELSIVDNFENTYSKQTPSGDISVNGQNFTISKDFDIVASSLAPKVEVAPLDGNDLYTDSNNEVWYSNKPTYTFSATDNVSKIHSMSVVINGTNQETNCTYNIGTQYTGDLTNFDDGTGVEENKLSNVTLNSNAIAAIQEGSNTIIVSVTGNNGVTSNPIQTSFHVDTESPVIQKFEFSNPQTGEPIASAKENGVVNTDYGYFFKDQTTVTITATDDILENSNHEAIKGSGVKTIAFFTKPVDGNLSAPRFETAVNGQASFDIQKNFKGQIYAYAIDNVNNNTNASNFIPGVSDSSMKVYTPDSVITETQAQHDIYSSIAINPTVSSSISDHKNNPLYNSNVAFTLVAESNFAGIKSIKTTVTSHQNQTDKFNGTAYTSLDGKISNGWSIIKTDQNLITRVQKSITIDIDSNDIVILLELEDLCGNTSSKSYTLSIDKTQPHIEVSFNPTDGNKVGTGDYYKTDRTATITVYERNFNPNDFVLTVNGSTNGMTISPGENWNTTYSVDVNNSDQIAHVATVTFHADNDYNMESAFTDMAGNEADNNHKKEAEFTVDQTVPVISITFDVNNSSPYYNVTRTATIRIEEHNFYDAYVDVKQTAFGPDNSTPTTPPSVSGWTTSGDVSTATITFPNDGKYSFTVDFKDKALNDAVQAKAADFYIDKKIDKIEIVKVEDLTAYDGEVAPEIHYFDQNFESATYLLKRIDYNKPAEAVDNIIPNEGSGNGYSKIVSYDDFERITENDGIYTLSADITDRAGNKDHKEVLFSVNRFGSNFMIRDAKTKELVEEKIYTQSAPDIIITEINVNEVSDPEIKVNRGDSSRNLKKDTDFSIDASGSKEDWYAYDYKVFRNNFNEDGNYTVKVTSKDRFDKLVSNTTAYKSEKEDRTCPVSFVVDTTPPVVTISGIDTNEYYSEAEKEVVVNCDDANITSEFLVVELDGEKFTNFDKTETTGNIELNLSLEADGNDREREFKVSIKDKAGNENVASEGGLIDGFKLGANWIQRLLHYHLPLVIIIGSVVLLGIGFLVFLAARKNKKKAEQ